MPCPRESLLNEQTTHFQGKDISMQSGVWWAGGGGGLSTGAAWEWGFVPVHSLQELGFRWLLWGGWGRGRGGNTAAAKWLQSCPTLCDPIDGSPPGPAVPGILQARPLEWVAISSSNA